MLCPTVIHRFGPFADMRCSKCPRSAHGSTLAQPLRCPLRMRHCRWFVRVVKNEHECFTYLSSRCSQMHRRSTGHDHGRTASSTDLFARWSFKTRFTSEGVPSFRTGIPGLNIASIYWAAKTPGVIGSGPIVVTCSPAEARHDASSIVSSQTFPRASRTVPRFVLVASAASRVRKVSICQNVSVPANSPMVSFVSIQHPASCVRSLIGRHMPPGVSASTAEQRKSTDSTKHIILRIVSSETMRRTHTRGRGPARPNKTSLVRRERR